MVIFHTSFEIFEPKF